MRGRMDQCNIPAFRKQYPLQGGENVDLIWISDGFEAKWVIDKNRMRI